MHGSEVEMGVDRLVSPVVVTRARFLLPATADDGHESTILVICDR